MGIKIKFAVILSLILFVTTSTMGAIMIVNQRRSLESQMRSMAGTITDEFAQDSKIPLLENDSLAMSQLVQNMLKYPGIFDVYILDDKNVIEGHNDLEKVGSAYADDGLLSVIKAGQPWILKETEEAITFASVIVFKDTTVGYTVVYFSKGFISERVKAAVTNVAMIMFFAIILVAIISVPLASGLLRPIFRLLKGTKEVAVGNLDYRIEERGRDEIGELVRSFNSMASELKKKEIMKGVFNRYVSPHVADEILKEPESLKLGGERREVTVFFADIRGFISHTRGMSPEETVEALNRYFTLITEITFRFEGTIDKFIGDAVMCVFGSPVRSENHLEQALKAAVAVRDALTRANMRREARGQKLFQMGIGLDTGEVIVGNMGSKVRMEYTAVGEAVNMASRLTGLAGGGEILISEDLYKTVMDRVEAVEVAGTTIKGIDTPARLYNIVGVKDPWKGEVQGVVDFIIARLEGEDLLP